MTLNAADWIAADWRADRLRVWVCGADYVTVLADGAGSDGLEPAQFENRLLALIEPHLKEGTVTTVICCGTAGGQNGWALAPYTPVPCTPPTGTAAHRITGTDPRIAVYLLPGLSQTRPPDMMRADETRIAGFIAAYPEWDGVLCLTGPQTRWVHISAGEVVSFRTFITGEMFDLLGGDADPALDEDAFAEAVSDAMSRSERVAATLFSLRAEVELNDMPHGTVQARLSGLLIGMELAAARSYWLGQNIALIGEGGLNVRYAAALKLQGVPVQVEGADEMTLRGLVRAHATLEVK